MPKACNALLIYPRFDADTFWNFKRTAEVEDGVVFGIASAQARIGRPLTPMSYAGVARRTTHRAYRRGYYYGHYY